MVKTAAWVAKNCKFAAETPFSPTGKGTRGFSHVYDLALFFLKGHNGIKILSKDAHVTKFAFAENAPPEQQIRLSWADHGDPNFPGVSVEVVENSADRWLAWASNDGQHYVLRTDSLHAFTPIDFGSVCYDAYHALEKRANRGLTPIARWGMAIRFLEHCKPIGIGI